MARIIYFIFCLFDYSTMETSITIKVLVNAYLISISALKHDLF